MTEKELVNIEVKQLISLEDMTSLVDEIRRLRVMNSVLNRRVQSVESRFYRSINKFTNLCRFMSHVSWKLNRYAVRLNRESKEVSTDSFKSFKLAKLTGKDRELGLLEEIERLRLERDFWIGVAMNVKED